MSSINLLFLNVGNDVPESDRLTGSDENVCKMYFLVSMKNMRLCLYILATYSMHGVTRCFEEKIASFC